MAWGYTRGPWPPNPACPGAAILDPPGNVRGASMAACPPGATCSEYAYFSDTTSVQECVELCCSDWSCWGFTFYATGRHVTRTNVPAQGASCQPSHMSPGCMSRAMMWQSWQQLCPERAGVSVRRHHAVLRAAERHARRCGAQRAARHSERREGQAARTVGRFVRAELADPKRQLRLELVHRRPNRLSEGRGTDSRAHTHAHTQTRAHTHAHTQTRVRTHAHTQMRAHARAQGGWSLGDEFPTTWSDDGFQYSGAGDNFGGAACVATRRMNAAARRAVL